MMSSRTSRTPLLPMVLLSRQRNVTTKNFVVIRFGATDVEQMPLPRKNLCFTLNILLDLTLKIQKQFDTL